MLRGFLWWGVGGGGGVSDQGLVSMAVLLQICEMCGQMPWQVSDVPVSFIDKPTGGVRGIGSNRAFNRMWQRARRQHVRNWETERGSHPAFSVCKGRSPTEAIWRQSVLAESGASEQKFVCLLLWDLRKCFEFVKVFVSQCRAWSEAGVFEGQEVGAATAAPARARMYFI